MNALTEHVDWLEWTEAAFERAGAERKPVLLFLTTSWCYWCDRMERTTFADPAVVQLSNERFVPVRVDADRRPDVAERYNLGGWPTVAFLSSRGELLGGGTFVAAEQLREVMPRIVTAVEARREALTTVMDPRQTGSTGTKARTETITDKEPLEWAIACLVKESDAVNGGFGDEPKVPHADGLRLAIELAEDTGAPQFSRLAADALDALCEGELFDRAEGGFFRYCARREWTDPRTEKLLDVNAALLRVYLRAWRLWRHDRYEHVIRQTLGYVQTHLADAGDGGFYASQRADPAYYALATAERKARRAPAVDRTMFADANAVMIRAYLDAGRAFDDASPVEFAVTSLERILTATYGRGAGVSHWVGERAVGGLLNDQVQVAAALLDAFEITDRRVYLDLAHELMLTAVRLLWNPAAGAFLDRRPGSIGRLRDPLTPLRPNCEAASVLARLAGLTGQPDLHARAVAVLSALGCDYREHGVDGAVYALTLGDVRRAAAGAGIR